MRLLRAIATLDPRHGGPAAGLRAITPELEAEGHKTEFVCFDDPAMVRALNIREPVHALGPVRPGYGYNPRLDTWLRANAERYDMAFIHGLWQYHGIAIRRAMRGRRPYFVFPHGMLDPWFGKAHPVKHMKKWIYWQLFERRVLRDAAAVLFTCEKERQLARQSLRPYQCTERVVSYGTARPGGDPGRQREAFIERIPEMRARPYILFMGRIHPKKGVDLLIDAYSRHVKETSPGAGAACPALVVAGPCDDPRYLESLTAAAAQVPKPGKIVLPGMLEGDAKAGALRGAEAFILPSHQENFGIAIVEAMAVGTPVLVSDKVNICAEIEADGGGMVEQDTVGGTLRLLRRWSSLGGRSRAAMAAAASASFDRRYEIRRTARSLLDTISPFMRTAIP
jgi:glycosyltransferase involved in cell wall biosynthesis